MTVQEKIQLSPPAVVEPPPPRPDPQPEPPPEPVPDPLPEPPEPEPPGTTELPVRIEAPDPASAGAPHAAGRGVVPPRTRRMNARSLT
jgi:protein TonB